MSTLLLSLMTLLSSVVVDVALTNGERITADLTSLDDQAVGLSADGKSQRISRNAVKQIDLRKTASTSTRAVQVRMIDDSIATCDDFTMVDGRAELATKDSEWQIMSTSLRAVRWLATSRQFDEQWAEIRATPGTDDLLVIRRNDSLDYLPGVVLGATSEAIEFEYDGNKIPVPSARVAGFILAKKHESAATPRGRVLTHNGDEWRVQSAVLQDNLLKIVSMASVSRTLTLAEISRIEFTQVGTVPLSELDPTSIEFEPFFGSALEQEISQLYNPTFEQDVSISDASSKSGSRQFRHGLVVQSRTELTYRLASKYQRFRATAGIDPASSDHADVELALFVDNSEVYRQSISKSGKAAEIDIDVAGARRLKLLVDYGENIHLGDRLYLGDARFIK